MRHLSLLILAALCGCDHGGRSPERDAAELPADQRVVDEPYPIVEGTIIFQFGDIRVFIAPAGSATPGSRWLEIPVTYTNASDRPVWVWGSSNDYPFNGVATRAGPADAWQPIFQGYCGTGAREWEIPPGASHPFTVMLPDRFVGQEFRVSLSYRTTPDDRRPVQAVSAPLKLARPTQASVN